MSKVINKRVALGAMTAVASLLSSSAFAHTTVSTAAFYLDKTGALVNGIGGTGTTGSSKFAAINVGHGCTDSSRTDGRKNPVKAESVVLPGTDAVVYTRTGGTSGTVAKLNGLADLGPYMGAPATYVPLVPGNLVSPILPQGPFQKTSVNYVTGTTQIAGWVNTGGSILGDNVVSFQPISIKALGQSFSACTKSVTMAVAIADVCKLGNTKPTTTNGIANTWLPNAINGQFGGTVTSGVGAGPDGVGSPGTATALPGGAPAKVVWNNAGLDTTACPTANQVEVFIYPSDANVTQYLKFPGFQP